jgi:hypothetical protein
MASQRDLVEQLFEAALALKPMERDAFLDKECRRDPELRRMVEALLTDDARAGSFLQHPPLDFLDRAIASGTRLNQYEILSPLGAGGMGEVYRARDSRLGRDVAIKVLASFLSLDPERLRRFEQEARAAAALNHPNILAVFQMGTYKGAPYLVSELLEGNTLRQLLQHGLLQLRKVVDYAVQVARGLAAAHEKGIVHRDLKPENLFVTKDSRIKILDFGLAKLTPRQTALDDTAPTLTEGTEPGMVMGTVGYMSPEQVRGQEADHRSDIFAFGAILYEMLTGSRAFRKATSADTMSAILNDDPPEISQTTPTVPRGLQRVVHRCLNKNPAERFQSASDLAFALETLSESNSDSAGSNAQAKTRADWARFRESAAAPAKLHSFGWRIPAVITICMVGVALWVYLLRPSVQNIADYRYTPFASEASNPIWSPDGKAVAYSGEVNGTYQIFLRYLNSAVSMQLTHEKHDTKPLGWSSDKNHVILLESTGRREAPFYKLYSVPVVGGELDFVMDSDCEACDISHWLATRWV